MLDRRQEPLGTVRVLKQVRQNEAKWCCWVFNHRCFMGQVAKLLPSPHPQLRRALPRQSVDQVFVKPEKQRLHGTLSGSICARLIHESDSKVIYSKRDYYMNLTEEFGARRSLHSRSTTIKVCFNGLLRPNRLKWQGVFEPRKSGGVLKNTQSVSLKQSLSIVTQREIYGSLFKEVVNPWRENIINQHQYA